MIVIQHEHLQMVIASHNTPIYIHYSLLISYYLPTMSPSTETIVNIIFGIVACLIAIGGVVATVRAGRNQRDGQIDFGGAQLYDGGRHFALSVLQPLNIFTAMITAGRHSRWLPGISRRNNGNNSTRGLTRIDGWDAEPCNRR
ncbi:hypothetical protein F4823DRAFT_133841 [Ustulina deusta]|nr:hypothetical protein F4823DRAFT_133841 [Ustulina deusta]